MINKTAQNIKSNAITQIEDLKSELAAKIQLRPDLADAYSLRLAGVTEWQDGVFARTIEHANDSWWLEFGSCVKINKHNYKSSFGEGFATLGTAFSGEITANMWTK